MTDDKRKRWSRTYAVFFKENPDAIMRLDERLADAVNHLGVSKSEAIRQIFLSGLSAMEDETGWAELDPEAIALDRELERIHKERAYLKRLGEVYSARGVAGFLSWAEEAGIPQADVDKFLEGYTYRAEDLQWAARAETFLEEHLDDGEPRPTNEIRLAAEAAGILDGSDEQWARLRVHASRHGWTRSEVYGQWQKSDIPL